MQPRPGVSLAARRQGRVAPEAVCGSGILEDEDRSTRRPGPCDQVDGPCYGVTAGWSRRAAPSGCGVASLRAPGGTPPDLRRHRRSHRAARSATCGGAVRCRGGRVRCPSCRRTGAPARRNAAPRSGRGSWRGTRPGRCPPRPCRATARRPAPDTASNIRHARGKGVGHHDRRQPRPRTCCYTSSYEATGVTSL